MQAMGVEGTRATLPLTLMIMTLIIAKILISREINKTNRKMNAILEDEEVIEREVVNENTEIETIKIVGIKTEAEIKIRTASLADIVLAPVQGQGTRSLVANVKLVLIKAQCKFREPLVPHMQRPLLNKLLLQV